MSGRGTKAGFSPSKKRRRSAGGVVRSRPRTDDVLGGGGSSAAAASKAEADLQWRMRDAKAAGRRTAAPLTPVLALDCVMVGVGANSEVSILAQVCVVNYYGRIVYETYVRPTDAVSGESHRGHQPAPSAPTHPTPLPFGRLQNVGERCHS